VAISSKNLSAVTQVIWEMRRLHSSHVLSSLTLMIGAGMSIAEGYERADQSGRGQIQKMHFRQSL
jgi:hypothetical protein